MTSAATMSAMCLGVGRTRLLPLYANAAANQLLGTPLGSGSALAEALGWQLGHNPCLMMMLREVARWAGAWVGTGRVDTGVLGWC